MIVQSNLTRLGRNLLLTVFAPPNQQAQTLTSILDSPEAAGSVDELPGES